MTASETVVPSLPNGRAIDVARSEPRGTSCKGSIYVVCAYILLLALTIRVGLIFATGSYRIRLASEVEAVANSLAQGRGFANAFGNTGPTAHMSPLYPLILSIVYRYYHSDTERQIGQEVLSSFLGAMTWALIPLLGEVCRLERRIGIAAALAGTLCINRWAETKGWFETALAGLMCIVVVIFFMKCWYSRDFSARYALVVGGMSGLAILASGSLAVIALGLLVTGYVLFRAYAPAKYLRFALISASVMFAVLLPWALRNYFVLGGFVWTRSNLPLELWVSNNDDARANFEDNEPAQFKRHPFVNPEQRRAIKTMGELAYQQELRGKALGWIASHPKRFAWLTLQRTYYFWFPKMKRPIQSIVLGFLTISSIPGLILLLKRKQPLATACLQSC